jgi:MinD superfamily P-loop ATPase
MKEITILSGKGGTGKTSITAAIASVAENAVFCDNDVDAADLHLIFDPEIKETHTFFSGYKATIHDDACTRCGICYDHCRFDAIHYKEFGGLYVNHFQCEGCRLCERVCPVNAITSERNSNNFWYVSDTRFGKLVHAKMGPGEENSGKLVSEIRGQAKSIAKQAGNDYVINDGPPGIGCAAISSVTGTNAVLLVIEPTNSGFHDIKRVIDLIESFSIPSFAVVNKFDINPEVTAGIEIFLKDKNIPLLAKLPFDKKMVEAMVEGKTIVEYAPSSEISKKIKEVWEKIKLEGHTALK